MSGIPYAATPPALGAPLGIVCTPWTVISTGVIGVRAANFTHFFRVTEPGAVSSIRTNVLVSSGNIAVAVYRNSGAGLTSVPGVRLATSGSIACPAAGDRDLSLGTTVQVLAGDWLALGADNTTAKFLGLAGNGGDTLDTGQSLSEGVFPPSATPSTAADSLALFALVGVP